MVTRPGLHALLTVVALVGAESSAFTAAHKNAAQRPARFNLSACTDPHLSENGRLLELGGHVAGLRHALLERRHAVRQR
jgi:hypothetical protein